MNSLGIAIDGGRYVRVDSRIGELPRSVRLRALNADQRIAVIDFCRFRKEKPEIIRSHRIGNLDASAGRPAEFRLRIERRSFAVWEARISGPGGQAETVRLRTRVGLWPLIFPIAALAGLLAWLLIAPPAFLTGAGGPEPRVSAPAAAGSGTAGTGESRETESLQAQQTQQTQPARTSGTTESPSAEPGTVDISSDTAAEPETPAQESIAAETDSGEDPASEVSEPAVETSPVIRLPEPLTVYFQPESAVLSPGAREDLADLAAGLDSGITLLIEGHSADYGTERGQRALSVLRARNAADFLESVLAAPVTMEIAGYGTDRPATLDPDRQDMNRRVVITFRETDR